MVADISTTLTVVYVALTVVGVMLILSGVFGVLLPMAVREQKASLAKISAAQERQERIEQKLDRILAILGRHDEAG